MNTATAPLLSAAALKTAALYQRIADIANSPALDGWDMIETDRGQIVFGHFIQLFPRRDELRNAGFAAAAPVARLFPGTWQKREDGSWTCECTGGLTGIRVHIHYVELPSVPAKPLANVIDLSVAA